jgi:hypothetical protein
VFQCPNASGGVRFNRGFENRPHILQVLVLIVIPFTILGQVLARTGGAAKISVVGSALFGMISGTAVSNVLAVGLPPAAFDAAIYINSVGITAAAAILALDWLRQRGDRRAPA